MIILDEPTAGICGLQVIDCIIFVVNPAKTFPYKFTGVLFLNQKEEARSFIDDSQYLITR